MTELFKEYICQSGQTLVMVQVKFKRVLDKVTKLMGYSLVCPKQLDTLCVPTEANLLLLNYSLECRNSSIIIVALIREGGRESRHT